MNYHGIDIPMDQSEAFCRRRGIWRLSLFGPGGAWTWPKAGTAAILITPGSLLWRWFG